MSINFLISKSESNPLSDKRGINSQQDLPYCDEVEIQEKHDIYMVMVWIILAVVCISAAIGIYFLFFNYDKIV